MEYVTRLITPFLEKEAEWFPVASISGPRQCGKSTLARKTFPKYANIDLDIPSLRKSAEEDPVEFIESRPGRLIIDEVQRVPDLFSMIKVMSDRRDIPGQYVITGSQNYLMMKNVKESLAGRVGLLRLLPFSYKEAISAEPGISPDGFMLKGGYPRIYSTGAKPDKYYREYVSTYLERDVAGVMDVRNIDAFGRFLHICAIHAGRLVNYTKIANDSKISVNTVKEWMNILEAGYIAFHLAPYYSNEIKRLTKTPKLFFYDTGLLCSLLGISTVEALVHSEHLGQVFENLVVVERVKRYFNRDMQPELYFYRDDSKREIDLLDFTDREHPCAFEIKSSTMYHDKYSRHLRGVAQALGIHRENCAVVTRGDSTFNSNGIKVLSASDFMLG